MKNGDKDRENVEGSRSVIVAALARRGWLRCTAESVAETTLLNEIGRLADMLGVRARGRGGALEEVVEPQVAVHAHPRSLSARYGVCAFPFHAELSHRVRPCRYLLLGCLDPGSGATTTTLLDWRAVGLSPEELRLLKSAPVLVRNGRRSFYATVLSSDETFLRYDPGCLEAVDPRGRAALRLLETRFDLAVPDVHEWSCTDILIIDNWRILHGRGASKPNSGRRLVRILIDA